MQEIPPFQQDKIALVIEGRLVPTTVLPSYAGSIPDLPGDFEEELMRRQHEASSTPSMDEQLQKQFREA